MFGPKTNGFWSDQADQAKRNYRFLRPGARYRVRQAFTDCDGHLHTMGSEWIFVGYNFSPYHDGLSLFVQTPEGEWHIRLLLLDGHQKAVDENLASYLEEVEKP